MYVGGDLRLLSSRFGKPPVSVKAIKQASFPAQPALPIKKFAAVHGVHPSTVWRALRDGRLDYVMVGKRKHVLPPVVQRNRPIK